MREIKFRAQRLGTKEWVYGDLVKHSKIDPFTYIAIGTGYQIDNPELGTLIKVYPHTVGQLTGLKDKNGKEIYEDDILGGHNPRYEKEGGKPSVVKWDNERVGFVIYRGDTSSAYAISSEVEWNEVIGNVHENGELVGKYPDSFISKEEEEHGDNTH